MPTPAQFDPDSFMAQQNPAAFDPDSFMAKKGVQPSAPAEQPGFLDDVGDTLKQYWGKINPVTQAQGVADLVTTDPRKTAQSYGDTNSKLYNAAKESFKKGDYSEGVRHSLSYFLNGIPGLGAALDEAGNKAGSGDYKGAIADTAALATQIGAGKVGPAVLDAATEPGALADATNVVAKPAKVVVTATRNAAHAVGAGVKAAAPDVVVGGAKALASEGLALVPGMTWPARIGLGYPAVRQIAKGLGKGVDAFRAYNPPAPVDLAAPPSVEVPPATSSPTLGTEQGAPLPESRQLEAGPRVIVPPYKDPSGVIKGWKPQILENENPAPAAPAPTPNAAPPGASGAPSPASSQVALPAQSTLDRLKLTPDDFLALPKDGQAEVMAMDRIFQNPKPTPPAAPVDLAPPPSVEQSAEPQAPGKTREQMLQEHIDGLKAARLAREAAAQPPVQAPPPAPANQPAGPIPNPAIGKDFGDAARLQPRADLPMLPGHTLLNSDMGQSIAYDPATREMQILFKRDGTLYRYPNVPPEAHQALMNAPSMGAHFQRDFRPKYPGIKMLTPGPGAPLLPGVAEPGVPPAADAAPLQPPPAGGNLPSDARLQGQGLPGAPPNGGGAPSQGSPNPQANGPLQPAPANATSVLIPGSAAEYPARYELRELADINASHNGNTFQPNPKYGLQNERDYTKRDNQGKVVANSGPLFDPRFHITDNPDATNGPIIVNENGDASAGNGRKMMLDRVYATNPRGAQAYRDLLAQKAPQFGIDPAQVAQMKQPVLVRVVSNADGARAMADLNKVGTAALTPAERAIADSKRVSPRTLNDISARMDAVGPDATLGAILAGRSGAEVLNYLIDDGVIAPQERAALAQGDDLTPAGKDRISKLMLGRFFRDPAQMDSIAPMVKKKLERIAGPVAAAEEAPGWGTGEHLKNAIDLIESAKAARFRLGPSGLDDFIKQGGLYSSQQFPPETVDLAKSLLKTTQGQALIAAKNYLEKARYARDYSGPGMFQQFPEPSNPPAALADFLQDIKKPPAPPKPQAAVPASAGNDEPGAPGSPESPKNPYR